MEAFDEFKVGEKVGGGERRALKATESSLPMVPPGS